MKLLLHLATILAAASATPAFTAPSQSIQPAETYAKSAELYQSALELQQRNLYSGQSQAHVHRDVAYQGGSVEKDAKILHYDMENNGHNYLYQYETDNGIKAQEQGQTTHGTQAQGGYSYTGDDGQVYTVTYTADENGFRASGAHLPTPPPIPEAIAKSLEENAQAEANGVFDDGKYKPEAEEDYQHQEGNNQQSTEHHISHPIKHSEHQLSLQDLEHPVPPPVKHTQHISFAPIQHTEHHISQPIHHTHHQISLPIQHDEHQLAQSIQHIAQPVQHIRHHIAQPIEHVDHNLAQIQHNHHHIAQPIQHIDHHIAQVQHGHHHVQPIQHTEFHGHHNAFVGHQGQHSDHHHTPEPVHTQRVTYHIMGQPIHQNFQQHRRQSIQVPNRYQNNHHRRVQDLRGI